MSTKALREVLGEAGMLAPDTSNEDLARKVAAAWKELEAIEKAAVELLGIWGYARHDIEAEKVMESIAKGSQS